MSNKVRGEFELDDLAVELIHKLNHLRVHVLRLPSFELEMKQLLAEGAFVEVWGRIVDASAALFRGDWKEVVDVYNIIFELLDTIDKNTQADASEALALKTVQIVTSSPGGSKSSQSGTSGKHKGKKAGFKSSTKENSTGAANAAGASGMKHVETRLIVLSNLYNAEFLCDFRDLRFFVMRSLVRFAAEHGKVAVVASFLGGVKEITGALAETTLAAQRETLLEIYQALQSYGEATTLAQTYLMKYLGTFNAESERGNIDIKVQALACTAIGASIGNVLAAQGRELLTLEAIKSLAQATGSRKHLYSLLGIFNNGQLPEYLAFHQRHPSVLAEFGIDHEKAVRSMRLLSFCSACNKAKDGRISYADAASAMGLKTGENQEAELESWILLAIKNGLVDVKMCQQTKKITIYSSTQRNFQPDQWADMRKKLSRWKSQIQHLLVTVNGIKTAKQRRNNLR